ncbi:MULTISPECIES: DUF6434 domain-containing protein [unclassified Methylophaga]|tara:strand:- start:294 stop:413 length:120 start_codon:yes stop_codon:yes gene_type:complete
MVDKLDWHGETITTELPVKSAYQNTQNVRRLFKKSVGLT